MALPPYLEEAWPRQETALPQHASSYSRVTDAVILWCEGNLCPRGPWAGKSGEKRMKQRG